MDDDLAVLEDRQLRLEEVAAEAEREDADSEDLFERLIADELSATSEKGKLKVRLKRLGIPLGTLKHQFNAPDMWSRKNVGAKRRRESRERARRFLSVHARTHNRICIGIL